MAQILPVGTRVNARDYDIRRATIIEHCDIGYGVFYRVQKEDGTIVDLDPTEVQIDKIPRR